MIGFLISCCKTNMTLPVVNTFPVSSLFKRFWKKTSVTSQDVEIPPAVETTLVKTPEAQREGTTHTEALLPLYVVVSKT